MAVINLPLCFPVALSTHSRQVEDDLSWYGLHHTYSSNCRTPVLRTLAFKLQVMVTALSRDVTSLHDAFFHWMQMLNKTDKIQGFHLIQICNYLPRNSCKWSSCESPAFQTFICTSRHFLGNFFWGFSNSSLGCIIILQTYIIILAHPEVEATREYKEHRAVSNTTPAKEAAQIMAFLMQLEWISEKKS